MVKNYYTLDALYNFLGDYSAKLNQNPLIKVTGLDNYGFNNMEGNLYTFNVSVKFEGYRGKRFAISTNSTYLDELEEISNESLTNYIQDAFI